MGQRRALVLVVLGIAVLEAALWVFAPEPDFLAGQGARMHRFLPAWSHYGQPPLEVPPPTGQLNGVARNDQPVEINRFGFLYPEEKRRRASPDEYRIAALGGSTVECVALRPENRWSEVLERRLTGLAPGVDVTVLNLGVSSQGTWTHLANVAQHVVDLDVDLIVLLIGANDLTRAREDDEIILSDSMFAANPSLTPRLVAQWLIVRTQMGRWLHKGYLALRREGADEPYFMTTLRFLSSLPVLAFEPEIRPKELDGYENAIVSIAAIASAYGIDTLFLTQPMLWRQDNTPEEIGVFWMNQFPHGGGLARITPGAAAHMLESLNRRLLDTCDRRELQCVDLAAGVPRTFEFFYDDLHFNDLGARRAAEKIAQAVLPRLRKARSR